MYTPKKTVLSEDSYAILNAIRNEVGGMFRANTPLVHTQSDAKAYGMYVTGSGDARNAFMGALINRIAQVVMFSRSYRNKLARYKKGMLEFGETVEDIFVNLAKPFQFDQETSESEVFKREIPDVRSAFYILNYIV